MEFCDTSNSKIVKLFMNNLVHDYKIFNPYFAIIFSGFGYTVPTSVIYVA